MSCCPCLNRCHCGEEDQCPTLKTSTDEVERVVVKADETIPHEPMIGYIERALDDLGRVLASKNQDYRIDGEFSNFEFVSDVVDTSVEQVILTQILIKIGRLKGLAATPNNEAALDTKRDIAGYAAILFAHGLSKEQ